MTTATHHTHGLNHRPGCTDPDRLREFTGHRGDHMIGCRACGAALPAHRLRAHRDAGASPPTPAPPPATPSRYALTCVRCDQTIPLHNPRPRIPICDTCNTPRKPTPTQERQ